MKALYLFLIFSALFFNISLGQSCLPNGIVMFTQQEIDDFPSNYPDCTEIEGDVQIGIGFSNVTNLDSLIQLTSVGGNFKLLYNQNLISISGMGNITDIGGSLVIDAALILPSLTGLENLTSIGEDLTLIYNYALPDLSPLSNLSSVGNDIGIGSNSVLSSLTGLENLTNVPGEILVHGGVFTDLTGLDNINSVGGNLKILNSNLTSLSGLENLTSVIGNLLIWDCEGISDLSPISNLELIEGNLYINNCNSLTDLSGLDNLTFLGGLSCEKNDNLINLSGLENLSSIEGLVSIYWNVSITELSGLDNITSINGYLSIVSNYALTNLSALENLESINGALRIDNNTILNDIEGIKNIDPTTITSNWSHVEDLWIKNNENLSICQVQSICDFLDLPDKTSVIENNDSGCNSEEEVQDACVPPECTSLVDPVNGESDVNIYTNLTWEPSIDATGYKLTLGTTPGGTDIMDEVDVGDVTTYDPGDFSCGSSIYVTIIPYNVIVDAVDCLEESFNIEEVIADAGSDVSICQGESIQLNATGGTSYSWDPTEFLNDPDISDPVSTPEYPIFYTVTVSNDGRCPETDDVYIYVGSPIIPNATATNETGYEFNDGTASCQPTGGNPPYSYLWSNGETDQTIYGLAPGNYSVAVADYDGCTAEDSVIVEEFLCPDLALEGDVTNLSCFNICDGVIEITTVINGTPPFNYNWSTGDSTAVSDSLCAGIYLLTVTDSTNCAVVDSFLVEEPDMLITNVTATDETSNDANDGIASANPTGGVIPYTYNWSNGENTQTIVDLPPGDYSVEITDSLGCVATDTVNISEYICLQLSISTAQSNNSCYDACDGSLMVSDIINGTAPFEYNWSNGSTESMIENLCSDQYSLIVTDSLNCSDTASYTVTQPDELLTNASATNETGSGANDGTASCSPTGGTVDYTYEWSTGETTQSISNLSPGIYTVTVVDSNECMSTDTVEVEAFGSAGLTVIATQNNASCFGECDGSINITSVDNSTIPLSYTWNTGDTTPMLENLCSGIFSVTVVDANNNVAYSNFTILEPDEILITIDSVQNILTGSPGFINISTNGNYTYDWTGPDGFLSNNEDISNISEAGCFNLLVTNDQTDCTNDTTICISDLTRSEDVVEYANKIKVYPNPSDDYFILDFSESKNEEALIIISNVYGNSSLDIIKNADEVKLKFDTRNFAPGMYIIHIQTEHYFIYKKIELIE